jgi:hypothetical protein
MYPTLYGLNHCKLSSAILDNRKFVEGVASSALEALYQPQSIENRLKGIPNQIPKVEPVETCKPLNGQLQPIENYEEHYRLNNNKIDLKSQAYNGIPNDNQAGDDATCGLSEDGIASICGTNRKLAPLMDPRFNLKEVSNNMILLEDHLNRPDLTCSDCIRKHSSCIQGYLSEALSLDKERKYTQEILDTNEVFNNVLKHLSQMIAQGDLDEDDCAKLAQEIRKIRKPLCQKYAFFGI